MPKPGFAVALVTLFLTPALAPAEFLPQIVGAPASYIPGTPYSFELRAPGVVDFTSFTVDLTITTTNPNPSSFLAITVTRPPEAMYSFGLGGSFTTSQFAVPLSNELGVHIEGGGAGVVTTPGANDLLATVTIATGVGVTDDITVSFRGVNFDLNPEVTPEVNAPQPFTTVATVPPTAPVPAPAAWLTFAVGGVLVAASRRFTSRKMG